MGVQSGLMSAVSGDVITSEVGVLQVREVVDDEILEGRGAADVGVRGGGRGRGDEKYKVSVTWWKWMEVDVEKW